MKDRMKRNQTPTAHLNWLAGMKLLKRGKMALALELASHAVDGDSEGAFVYGIFMVRHTKKLLGRKMTILIVMQPNNGRIRAIREKTELMRVKRVTWIEVEKLRDSAIGALLFTGLLCEGHSFKSGKPPRRGEPRTVVLAEHYQPSSGDICHALSEIARISGDVFIS